MTQQRTLQDTIWQWMNDLTAAGWTLADAVQETINRIQGDERLLRAFVRDFGSMGCYAVWERHQSPYRQQYREQPISDGEQHEDDTLGHATLEALSTNAEHDADEGTGQPPSGDQRITADTPTLDEGHAATEAPETFAPVQGARRVNPANVQGVGFFDRKKFLDGGQEVSFGDLSKAQCLRLGKRLVGNGWGQVREGRALLWFENRLLPGTSIRDVLSEADAQRAYSAIRNGKSVPRDIIQQWEQELGK